MDRLKQKYELYKHLRFDSYQADCATAVMVGLLGFKPDPLSIEALYDNAVNLIEIALITKLELELKGISVLVKTMSPEDRPSHFFNQIGRACRHGAGSRIFLGGLVETKDKSPRHVVGILGLHEGAKKKITLLDTAPSQERSLLVRKVPLEWLDRRILQESNRRSTNPSAVALLSRSNLNSNYIHRLQTESNDLLLEVRELLIRRAISMTK